jgi:1-acyl-sn-glycerol-3-phosphate acyltransferase
MRPLPHLDAAPGTRVICRLLSIWAVRHIRRVDGVEHIRPEHDPFILALNHSQRVEALIVPAFLIHQRDGRLIHFLADWNFLLVPLVATAFRASGTIVVGRKSARPRVLNALRRRLVPPTPPFARAAAVLAEGRAVGIFPEGTTNRDPERLLRGDSGAARLSLSTGVPVVPAGIRFPGHSGGGPVGALEPLELHIGVPLQPPQVGSRSDPAIVRAWHAEIMGAIARLSGKSWIPRR